MKWKEFLQTFVLLCCTLSSVSAGVKASIVTLSRCRVECLKQHTKNSTKATDKSCNLSPDCHSCWEACSYLFDSYNVWASICNKDEICKPGCKTACKFRENRPKVKKSGVQWQFAVPIDVKTDSLNTIINWPRPLPDRPVKASSPFVYTLMARNASRSDKSWHQYVQKASEGISIKTDQLPYIPEFKLVAVNDEGLVAETKFKPDFNIIGVIDQPRGSLRQAESGFKTVDDEFNLSYNITELRNGELEMVLYWDHPPQADKSEYLILYDVHWLLSTCNFYDGMPNCDHPDEHRQVTTNFPLNVKPHRSIKNLLYNSEYTVQVELFGKIDVNSYITLTTPKCETPDITFSKCIRLSHEEQEKQDKIMRESDALIWHLNYTSMVFNPNTYTVDVNVTWSTPFNQSAVNYSVAWQMVESNNYLQIGRQRVPGNYYIISLQPESFYQVRAEAEYMTDAGQPNIYDSEWLYINTSFVDLSIDDVPLPVKMKDKDIDDAALRSVIIGVACITSLVVLFLVIIIYKKRKSFKDIIITKSTVAKSNSYKSNVGAGKSDYSNQLMIISDEWELDPSQLKFCAPVGQGAFGKVVTGYLDERKVAIKLVKEGAPLSYREDLVAEINLMKRIGSHPNIVTMIGACTICEPVALVMEYIPHGNLQTFLKKCRMEGDFRRGTDGQSEIIYSLVQDSGGIENGVIVPSDMLSFARQVAIAMEYMAEKKYVHRDLAARNILLHHNKLVKVCDFGLSRDIYNDNEYKKLTNGKLPLKWMAIESLRDRIFTTHTDVWSFGILLWEIVTMGASPYPNIALADLYHILSNGYRMEKPSNCSEELYRIMRSCWEDHPGDRPSFTSIILMLEELLEQDCDYLLLDNIDVPLNLSENSSNPIDSSNVEGGATGLQSPAPAPPRPLYTGRKDKNLKVNVCVHDQSTERLIYRPSESDSTSSP